MDLSRLKEYYQLKLVAEKQFADVLDAVEKGDPGLLLIDIRAREEYEVGHIRGAVSMPLDEIDRRHLELPREREVVTYCYNQHCHLSARAALKLLEYGILAKEMNVGWKEWVAAKGSTHSPKIEDSDECHGQCRISP